jgi:hypothetical protein
MWAVRGWVLAGTFRNVLLIVAALAVLGITSRILGDWRNGVYFFLAWLLFEDLIRKYMGNAMFVYFAKDALVAVVYASFLKATSRGKVAAFRPPFLFPLGLFFALGLAQMFNSGSPSILYGILGMKLYFYYVPLMFVGYALLRDEKDLHRFLVANVALAAPIALLGIAQSVFGLDFMNPHAGADLELLGHLTRYTQSGVAVSRPPSVFVSDGRFDEYLVLAAILGIGAAGYLLLRTKRGRKIVFPALALLGLAAMLSGSRGSAVWVGASALFLSAGMLWGAPPRAAETYRLVKAIRRTFIVIALSLSLGTVLFPQAIGARWQFYAETLDPRSEYYEVSYRAWDYPVNNFLLAFTDRDWVVGHGIGTQSLGVQYVAKLVGQDVDDSIGRFNLENGWATLIWELGVLGPILWVLWSVSFVYAAWKATMRVKGTPLFPVALSIFWYAFLLLLPLSFEGLSGYQNFVINAYFWVLAGILFRLPKLVGGPVGQFAVNSPQPST